MRNIISALKWLKKLPMYTMVILSLGWSLTENLQAQTLKNNNTIYINDYTKEEMNLPQTRDQILQGLSPEIQKETMRIWNNVLQSPYAEVYMRWFANPLSRPRPTNQQKAFLLIIMGDIHQDSKLKQTAWQNIENDKVLLRWLNSRFNVIKSSINIILLDEQIAEADKIIEWQENTLKWQENTLKWQENTLKWQENTLKWQENIKKTLDMIQDEIDKHLEKTTSSSIK